MANMVCVAICDGTDDAAIVLLRKALDGEGAELIDKSWAIGTDLYTLKIGNEEICIFIDAWSCDIEGSQEVVDRVRLVYEQLKVVSRSEQT
jgi:hypothetical protein